MKELLKKCMKKNTEESFYKLLFLALGKFLMESQEAILEILMRNSLIIFWIIFLGTSWRHSCGYFLLIIPVEFWSGSRKRWTIFLNNIRTNFQSYSWRSFRRNSQKINKESFLNFKRDYLKKVTKHFPKNPLKNTWKLKWKNFWRNQWKIL